MAKDEKAAKTMNGGTESGFFTSPEFLSQLASQGQGIWKSGIANDMVQTGLATGSFSKNNALLNAGIKGGGLGDGFDAVGGTLKSSAIMKKRLADAREAERQKLLQDREMSFDDVKKRRMEAQVTRLEQINSKG